MHGGAWKAAVHGVLRVRYDWATSLSLFTFMNWRKNGNPPQHSCLENPRDGGAWWVAIYGVIQSRTRLKWLSNTVKTGPSDQPYLPWLAVTGLSVTLSDSWTPSLSHRCTYPFSNPADTSLAYVSKCLFMTILASHPITRHIHWRTSLRVLLKLCSSSVNLISYGYWLSRNRNEINSVPERILNPEALYSGCTFES